MSAALITATLVGIAGLGYCTAVGFAAASSVDILRHTTLGIFFTLLTLLTHSMSMFYLIGKGKAVREAVEQGGLAGDHYAAIAHARRPVFSTGTVAMALTMVTVIIGGGVDTGIIPPVAHAVLALSAIAANLIALRVEVIAFVVSGKIVAEVDRALQRSANVKD